MDNGLNNILRMMAKIDDTYTNKRMLMEEFEDDIEGSFETSDDEENVTPYGDITRGEDVIDDEPVDNTDSVWHNKKTVRQSMPFDVDNNNQPIVLPTKPKFNKSITNQTLRDKKYTGSEVDGEQLIFSEYVDTNANLQWVMNFMEENPTITVSRSEIFNPQTNITATDNETERSNFESPAISYVNGYGASSSPGVNITNTTAILFAKYFNENFGTNIPNSSIGLTELKRQVDNLLGFDGRSSLSVGQSTNHIQGFIIKLEDNIKKGLSRRDDFTVDNINDLKEIARSVIDKEGLPGDYMSAEKAKNLGKISNIQAYYLAKGLDGTRDNESNVGLLATLPPSFDILRSVSYVMANLRNMKGDMLTNYRITRDLIFKSKTVQFSTIRVKYGKNLETINYNPVYDDPLTKMSLDELLGNASYVVNNAISTNESTLKKMSSSKGDFSDVILGGISGKLSVDRNDVSDFKGNTKTRSEGFYSLTDYVFNLLTVLTYSSGNKNADAADVGFTYLYKTKLKGFYKTIDSIMKSEYSDILRIVPLTDIMDPTIKADDYINKLILKSGNDSAFKSMLSEVCTAYTKRSKRHFDVNFNEGDGNLTVFRRTSLEDSDEKIETTSATLGEFFSEILISDNSVHIQDKILSMLNGYIQKSGIGEPFKEELNRYTKDNKIAELIGSKSIDIYIKGRNGGGLAIEYQGEQHYVPPCCMGIKKDDIMDRSFGRANMKMIDVRNQKFGKFLWEADFSKRMTTLMEEAMELYKEKNGNNAKSFSGDGLLNIVWEYLTILVNNGYLNFDSEENNSDTRKSVSHWKSIVDVNSRRRWYEEFSIYLQQAKDKQKYLALKNAGWECLYICPPGNVIGWQDIYNAGSVKYAANFNLPDDKPSLYKIDEAFTRDKYNDADNYLTTPDENNPAYKTYRYSTSGILNNFKSVYNPEITLEDAIKSFFRNENNI